MDSSNNNLVSNRTLSPEERSQLMTSPELNLRSLPNLPDFNTDTLQNTVRFSSAPTVFEEPQQPQQDEQKEEAHQENKEEKNQMTGSTFFRTLASYLQTQSPQGQQQAPPPPQPQQQSPVNSTPEAQKNYQRQIIDNLLLNLEIISRIKENDKLSNQDKIIEIDTRVGQFFRRWFTGDSRNRSLSRIEEIVELTIDVTRQLLEDEYDDSNKVFDEKEKLIRSFETNKSEYFQKFSKNMADAIHGLNNLKKTYENDEAIKSRIDLVIEKLTQRLSNIRKKLTISLPTR